MDTDGQEGLIQEEQEMRAKVLPVVLLVMSALLVLMGCPSDTPVEPPIPEGTAVSLVVGNKQTHYESFATAFAAIPDGASELILRADVDLESALILEAGKNLELNLNGKTLEIVLSDTSLHGVTIEQGASLDVKDSGTTGLLHVEHTDSTKDVTALCVKGTLDVYGGTISSKWSPLYITGDRTFTQSNPFTAIATLHDGRITAEDDTVTEPWSYGVFLAGKTAKFIMNGGTIDKVDLAVSLNGTYSETKDENNAYTEIEISGGEISANETGIYLSGYGTTSISGGSIIAPSGVEIRAGELTITGGSITGTGEYSESSNPVSGQTAPNGAALAIINIGYPSNILGDMKISISDDAVITSAKGYGIIESTKNNEEAKFDLDNLTISGGTVSGKQGAFIHGSVSKMGDVTHITSGSFSSDISEYLAEGYTATEQDGRWIVSAASLT